MSGAWRIRDDRSTVGPPHGKRIGTRHLATSRRNVASDDDHVARNPAWSRSWHHRSMTSAAPTTKAEPTHPCARCGAPVGPGIGLCERCNPLGLRDSASSQVHGSVFIGVVVAVIGLALFARLAVAGVGPFGATVDDVAAATAGLAVTLTVTNDGAAAGQTTCQVTRADGGSGAALVLTPRLDPGERQTFQRTVTELGATVRPLVVSCRTP